MLVAASRVERLRPPLPDDTKVFGDASKLQLDCMVEEGDRDSRVKPNALLSLADLPVPPHNGPSLTEMPVEPSDIKSDPAAGDTSASIGERKKSVERDSLTARFSDF